MNLSNEVRLLKYSDIFDANGNFIPSDSYDYRKIKSLVVDLNDIPQEEMVDRLQSISSQLTGLRQLFLRGEITLVNPELQAFSYEDKTYFTALRLNNLRVIGDGFKMNVIFNSKDGGTFTQYFETVEEDDKQVIKEDIGLTAFHAENCFVSDVEINVKAHAENLNANCTNVPMIGCFSGVNTHYDHCKATVKCFPTEGETFDLGNTSLTSFYKMQAASFSSVGCTYTYCEGYSGNPFILSQEVAFIGEIKELTFCKAYCSPTASNLDASAQNPILLLTPTTCVIRDCIIGGFVGGTKSNTLEVCNVHKQKEHFSTPILAANYEDTLQVTSPKVTREINDMVNFGLSNPARIILRAQLVTDKGTSRYLDIESCNQNTLILTMTPEARDLLDISTIVSLVLVEGKEL